MWELLPVLHTGMGQSLSNGRLAREKQKLECLSPGWAAEVQRASPFFTEIFKHSMVRLTNEGSLQLEQALAKKQATGGPEEGLRRSSGG